MPEIAKVSYTHEALIDLIITAPGLRQKDLAEHFGYSEPWMSTIMSSDAFKSRLEARRAEIVNPALVASVQEKLEGLASRAVEKLNEKLDVAQSTDALTKIVDVTTRALGYGARMGPQVVVQNNFVAEVPPKSRDAQTWEGEYAPVVAGAGAQA